MRHPGNGEGEPTTVDSPSPVQVRIGPLSYRTWNVKGNWIHTLTRIAAPDVVGLRRIEDKAIDFFRCTGAPLLNANHAVDNVEHRRQYMRAWRERNGQGTPDSYMSRKGREHRERRKRLRAEQEQQGQYRV